MTARHITIFSSRDRCGIQTYAATLADAFRSLGHRVDLVGIGWWDSGALLRESGRVARGSDLVIVEHEFALYKNGALALAMLRMRLAGKRVLLSIHELEPDKFMNYHKVVAALHYRMRGSPVAELFRLLASAGAAAQRIVRYRIALWLLGLFPHRIVFHSPRARSYAWLVTGDERRIAEIPHFVEPLPGVADPSTIDVAARTRELRARLGLPQDATVFVSPGFLFRRKRLVDVVAATPPDATIVLAGTEQGHDVGYLVEIRSYVAERGLRNVVIDTDYARMPDHLLAADAVVLFYRDAFQSGIASHAIWAEQPCIFSDDPAFDMYDGAGLRASDVPSLTRAMEEVRRPEVAARLRECARQLKKELSPEAMAQRYLDVAGG